VPSTSINRGSFSSGLRPSIDYSAVSDDQYLEDLGNNIDATSTRRLTQRGDLTYLGKGWSLLGRVQAFQNLDQVSDPGSRPYQRMPQLLLTINPRSLGPGLIAGMDAEYDFFDHAARVYGQRFDAADPELAAAAQLRPPDPERSPYTSQPTA
jgi:LPS-assembly protein